MTTIRSATPADAQAALAIYRLSVETGIASFEWPVPTVTAFAGRIATALEGWAWLVAEVDGTMAGYAYGGRHRERHGYRWSVETSAYLRPDFHRRGVGSALYVALLARLAERGYCNAYAGITLPNEASLALHRRMGFQPVGVFARVGWKFGAWQDVAWLQRSLREWPLDKDAERIAPDPDALTAH